MIPQLFSSELAWAEQMSVTLRCEQRRCDRLHLRACRLSSYL